MNFNHLKIYTGHSLTKSIININDLSGNLQKRGFNVISTVDQNNIFNSVEMYKSGLSKGLKPIIGSTLFIYNGENKYEMSFYVKNKQGYYNLNKLLTRAYIENNKSENTGILEEWLTKESLEGLIVISGARHGKIGQYILNDNIELAKQTAKHYQELLGNDFFIELQRDAHEDETKYMTGAVSLIQELKLNPVATHPVYFLNKEDFIIHEIKTCINSQDVVYNPKRTRLFNKEMYLKNNEEMLELFSDLPQAIENTNIIASKCNFQLELGNNYLPRFPTENNLTESDMLLKQAQVGLEHRLKDFSPEDYKLNVKKYEDRLNWELSIINKMGFAGYFLIVADFISFAKSNDIPVGPGRGSGAGSLVAYSLGITDLDPLPYNLLFERFLNPERVSMPDFDIDFCPEGRNEVIQYVKNKYGHDKVSQISTFGTLAARAAIKDVGKVLGYPYGVTDSISKLITIPPAKAHEINLSTFLFGDEKKGIEPDSKLLNLYNTEKDVKLILDYSLKIEGLPRQIGMHAGGVLISPTDISNFTPLYKKDSNGDIVSQFDKDSVEKVGLVKFDFLGTDILTIIKKTLKKVNKKRKQEGLEELDINKIDIRDEAVFSEIFASGNTTGIFQFESSGMKSLFKQINPDKFEDIVALNALYRPGPMDIIPEWIESKKTIESERHYPHPLLKDILKETYGYMIYQEQVMQCAQIIAGYSLGRADILRRAMGKKQPEEMAKQRSIFVAGAAKNGIDENKANELFDLIDKFSGYGFNKSHAAAYSLVAYQTAYLKYYYTAEYISSFLNANLDDTDTVYKHILDAQKNKIKILPPDINHSEGEFLIENSESLRYGLVGIKGVGDNCAEFIKTTREEKGNFTDIFDFLEKIPRGTIQKRSFDPMIHAGVFDSIHPNRAQLFEYSKQLLDYHKKYHDKKIEESNSILSREIPDFAATNNVKKTKVKIVERPIIESIPEWDELTKLDFEKNAIGFYLTGDPTNYYLNQLNGFVSSSNIPELESQFFNESKSTALVSGIITEIREYKSKNGAFVKIFNNGNTLEMLVKKEFFNKHTSLLKLDNFAAFNVSIFQGSNGVDDLKYSVKNVYSLNDCKKELITKIFIGSEPEKLDSFKKDISKHPGKTPILFCVANIPCGRKKDKLFETTVEYSEELITTLESNFGKEWVKFSFNSIFPLPEEPKRYKKKF